MYRDSQLTQIHMANGWLSPDSAMQLAEQVKHCHRSDASAPDTFRTAFRSLSALSTHLERCLLHIIRNLNNSTQRMERRLCEHLGC